MSHWCHVNRTGVVDKVAKSAATMDQAKLRFPYLEAEGGRWVLGDYEEGHVVGVQKPDPDIDPPMIGALADAPALGFARAVSLEREIEAVEEQIADLETRRALLIDEQQEAVAEASSRLRMGERFAEPEGD